MAAPSPRDAARADRNDQLWLIIANDSITGWEVVDWRESDDERGDGCVHRRFVAATLLPV
jgi:hypothetical protein